MIISMNCDTKVWHILVTNSKWAIKIIFDPTFTSFGLLLWRHNDTKPVA